MYLVGVILLRLMTHPAEGYMDVPIAPADTKPHSGLMSEQSGAAVYEEADAALKDAVPVDELTSELERLAAMLELAETSCRQVATGLVPSNGFETSICSRYESALARWPEPKPSYERLASLIAEAHDTASSIGAAARRCQRLALAAQQLASRPPLGRPAL